MYGNAMRATHILGPRNEEQLFTLEELMNFHKNDARRLTMPPGKDTIVLEVADQYSYYRGHYTWTVTYTINEHGGFWVEGLDEHSLSDLEDSFERAGCDDPFVAVFRR